MAETRPTTRARGFAPLRVRQVEPLCADAAAVTFDVPEEWAADFAFRPGQSITVRREVDGREERRSYSICAPVGPDLRVGVREVADGVVSSWLVRDVRPGDTVEVLPPSGRFVADPAAGGRHVLIAAGSGITPMLSIAGSLLGAGDAQVTLFYGNRHASSVMFAEELADLKDAHGSRFELVHVLSREPREVELFTGRLDRDRLATLLDELVPVAAVDGFWLCGPHEMVVSARTLLGELGVPAERVHAELFYVEDAAPPPVRHREPGVSGPTAAITVVLDGRRTELQLPYDETVLDSAQRSRADLPFACKGGVCGTCRARVTAGSVDMRRNYALEDAEVEAGFVLTCQSYPDSASACVDFDA
ncbi:1,2-phenylacetyl-CoA epoxidase subunit PaaE [Nocardioides terrisoli]|uniref:1,2-phenylacetyl-CoA epoxidase subunit PaaE n=1 Tax=Nocardioides terrisoli TaxID=3388267 RepID=UPI00287B61E2|nr:1,2-phenylacetyl-CoA epoxidase subunit PaaE [Nocardioides marmorisolisilvae]